MDKRNTCEDRLRLRIVLCAVLVVLTLGLAPAVAQPEKGEALPAAAAKPKIRFEKETFQFGKIKALTPMEHTFVFHNDGEGELEILRVRASCGKCVRVGDFTKKVKPGGKGMIHLILRSDNLRGNVKSKAWVDSNDPDQPRMAVYFAGEVFHPIKVKPSLYAYFHRLSADRVATRELTIEVQGEDAVKVTEAKCSHEKFKAELTEVEAGKKYTLKVSTVPPLKQGRTSTSVVLKTDSKDYPELKIQVSANVQPRVHVNPDRLYITLPMERDWQRTLFLYSMDEKPVTIKTVQVTPAVVKSEVSAMAAGSKDKRLQGRITLSLAKDAAADLKSGEVVIETDDAEFPKITVPLRLRNLAPKPPKPVPKPK